MPLEIQVWSEAREILMCEEFGPQKDRIEQHFVDQRRPSPRSTNLRLSGCARAPRPPMSMN
jgi:hypothetical protein